MLFANGHPATGVPLRVAINGSASGTQLHAGSHTSDERGFITVKLAAGGNREPAEMRVSISTEDRQYTASEQATATHFIRAADVEHDGGGSIFIKTNNNLRAMRVGDTLQADLVLSNARPSRLFAFVVNKGEIVKLLHVRGDQRLHLHIDRHMVPSVRVVAVAAVGNRFLTDSLVARVEPEDCPLSVRVNSANLQPGRNSSEFYELVGNLISFLTVSKL